MKPRSRRRTRTLPASAWTCPSCDSISKPTWRSGLSERLSFHAGDFFADSLPAADVLIMGHVLHDWGLEKKRMLIRKAYAALSRQTAFPYVAWTPG